MRIDELHKFSDGTLNDVRNTLDDRLKRIRMQYLPTTIWRRGDTDRAAAMIQAIDKMLNTRRIMRSLEKFVGGRLSSTTASVKIEHVLSGENCVNDDMNMCVYVRLYIGVRRLGAQVYSMRWPPWAELGVTKDWYGVVWSGGSLWEGHNLGEVANDGGLVTRGVGV
nr:hypothetical protein [Tanacetum cinerariifolium]